MVDSMIRIFGSALNQDTSFTSNGLGVLSEAISCIVTEERNGAYELELQYPMTGAKSEYLQLRNIIVAKPNPYANPQPFRIYAISKSINKTLIINAEHISYDLNGYVAQVLNDPVDGLKAYFTALKSTLSTPEGCPFTFQTDTNETTAFKVKDILPIRTILGNHNGYEEQEEDPSGRIVQDTQDAYILDKFPGEYEWDGLTVKHYRVIAGQENYQGRGRNYGVSIRYGKNLTSFQQDENCQNVYTGVYPYWHYTGYRHDLVELPEKYISASGTYDHVKILPLDLTSVFPRRPSDDDMREYVQKYMAKNDIGTPKVSFDVEFIPLSQTEEYKDYAILEQVHLCDTVTVVFPLMNVSATSQVVKTVYDVISGRYKSISLGDLKNGVADLMVSQTITTSQKINNTELEKAVITATEAITGYSGGHVVLDPPNNPTQILIMDTPDKETARNVWRWTAGGLGHSSTGINGPYSDVAITADGAINANFITVGLLNGDRIAANSITGNQISVEYTNEITAAFTVADEAISARVTNVNDSLSAALADTNDLVNTVSLGIDGLNARFQEQLVNGINKIQNSSGLNGINDWVEVEGGTQALSQDDSSTDSGSKIVLNNKTIYQEVVVTPGTPYTLSVKVRTATSALSYISITDGGNEQDVIRRQEVNDSWTTYYKTITPGSSTIRLTLSSAGNSMSVADLMLAPGSVKQNWTPAPNEIYTTNVKIDRRGINITNDSSSTQTIIDNTQFAVKQKLSGGDLKTVLTVNKDRTLLRKTEVLDEFTVGDEENTGTGKIKFIPVSGGVDLVFLD